MQLICDWDEGHTQKNYTNQYNRIVEEMGESCFNHQQMIKLILLLQAFYSINLF